MALFRALGALVASTALFGSFGSAHPFRLSASIPAYTPPSFGRTRSRARVPTRRRPIPWDATQTKIQRMTNWQRTQWARAGYPVRRVDEFLAMERRHVGR